MPPGSNTTLNDTVTVNNAIDRWIGSNKGDLEKLWSVPEADEDADFKGLETLVFSKLPEGHLNAAKMLIAEMEKKPVVGGRRLRGGADAKFYIKCMFLALIEVIADGLAVAPKLAFGAAIGTAAIIAAVANNLGAVGAAGVGAASMGAIMKVYNAVTQTNSLTLEAAAVADAAEVGDDDVVQFVPLTPPNPMVGITTPMEWVVDEGAAKAYGEEAEEVPAGAEATSPLKLWVHQLQANPNIAGAFKPTPEKPFDARVAVTKTFLFVFSVFYLVKLAQVINRQAIHEAQLAAIAAQAAPAAPAGLAQIVGMAAAAAGRAAPHSLMIAGVPAAPVVVDPAVAAAAARVRRRRVSAAAAAAAAAAALAAMGGVDSGVDGDVDGGRRRTRRNRRRRHRLSGPTRKAFSRRPRPTGR